MRKPHDPKVVAVRRLVINDRDSTRRTGAERVLDGGVGVASGADQNVLGGLVRGALDLVEGAGVRAVKSANRAVGSCAWGTPSLIDVAGAFRPGPSGSGGSSRTGRAARGVHAACAGGASRASLATGKH